MLNRPTPYIRPAVADIEEQQILAVAKLGLGDSDVVAMWYGESDLPTDAAICAPVGTALARGETFYTHKRGLPELRTALSDYLGRTHAAQIPDARVTVTASGMSALALTLQAIVDMGDNVIVVCPEWPNVQSAVRMMGGEVRFCSLEPDAEGRFHLDQSKIEALCDARTRAVFVNSPNNPTGWTMQEGEIVSLLALVRRLGIWLICDEVYDRISYTGKPAPSVLPHLREDDPVVVINSFSKSWAMTGWRIGWMVHPPVLDEVLGNLIEFNYSCVPEFVQRGAMAAITQGEDAVQHMIARCEAGRDIVARRLPAMAGIEGFRPPDAAFYAYFRVAAAEGRTLEIAQGLVRDHRVGIAPGTAFGPTSDGFFRLCFALDPDKLNAGLDRLEKGLAAL